jgi:hypothetical protein
LFFNIWSAAFVAMIPLTSWLSFCHFGCGSAALGSLRSNFSLIL